MKAPPNTTTNKSMDSVYRHVHLDVLPDTNDLRPQASTKHEGCQCSQEKCSPCHTYFAAYCNGSSSLVAAATP
jgi:hypothetical protein